MATRIALVGDEQPNHPSHRELNAVRALFASDVESVWVPTDAPEASDLSGYHGVWLVPGSPYASDEAAYRAITWAREQDVPFLGTCGGMQYAVLELFRNLLGVADASHAESDGGSVSNVVTALTCSLQGELRDIHPVAGTRFSRLVGGRAFPGMHYCSFASDPEKLEQLIEVGVSVQATAEDAGAEVIELSSKRFFMASMFQPQVGALSGEPLHPLIGEFIRSAKEYSAFCRSSGA